MIILLTGIFGPLLAETPKATSNANAVVTENSNNAVSMSLPSTQVDVHHRYSQEPAPIGIADYGISLSGPYEYATNDSVGIVNIASLSANGSLGIQLNVNFVFNTSLGQYVYWIQDVATISSTSHYIDFWDNVWNISAPDANLRASGISGKGEIGWPGLNYSGHWYDAGYWYMPSEFGLSPPGDDMFLAYPVTITFNVTSSITSSGESTVSFGYNDGYGMVTYDTVTFTNMTGPVSSTGFEVNGFSYTPSGGFYECFYDSELILGGPYNGLNVTDVQSDVQLQLEYWNGHNYELVPNAYNFGEDGEGMDDAVSGFSYSPENGTMFAEILPGAGQLGQLYDASQIGIFNVTSPLAAGTLYIINASDPTATASQTSFVNGDVTVTLYPGRYDLQLYNQYGQLFDQGDFTVNAGQTLNLQTPLSPATHNVTATNILSTKTVIGQGFGDNLTVQVADTGDYDETFNVSAYANSTVIGTEQVSLNATEQTSLTFSWNTTDLAYGNYTLSGYAWLVPDETSTTDNNFTGVTVKLTLPGDINGDFSVSPADLVILTNAYGSKPGDTKWNPNADINGNNAVDLTDLVIMANHYGQQLP